ncbi:MAG TPA: urate hydroxylase PuuD [Steroidobacteraceae bacterium]|nr:urate hydroxylase PuuD [Steroidobacteraceae bacterium]
MTGYLLDWGGLLIRWIHITTGIAWIGSSFYFVWLDDHLLPPEEPDAEAGVAGELWAVHGGGFYRARKYRVAPDKLPRTLHWFYWEAYSTWLSGIGLLSLLYFFQADVYLIDPAVHAFSRGAAVAIAVGILVGSWLLYDALCRSRFGRNNLRLAAAVALLACALAWGVCSLFSGRGAFIMFGAAIGTIMVANVFFVIIPGQRELVAARQQGREVDPAAGLRGKQRSVHNTYFTLPVLFVMISNHYAMTYAGHDKWLVLIAMSFSGVCIRAWFVARHKPEGRQGVASLLPLLMGVLALVIVIIGLYPDDPARAAGAPLSASQAQVILGQRCVPCHSRSPTQRGFNAPPNGIVLDSAAEVRAHVADIRKQLTLRTMPLGNVTGMTDAERARLLQWLGPGPT